VRTGPLDVPAIMISGFMPWDEADLEWLLRSGAVMEKPFSMADLLAKVRSILTPTTRAGEIRDGQTLREFDRHQPPPLGARVAG
jgi:DNA-binding response OmpR family regulator